MIVTIDGPAGSGKSTLAKMIAQRLGFTHLDSGALYRAIGVAAKEASVKFTDAELSSFLKKVSLELKGGGKVTLNGVDFSEKIRTPSAGKLASAVAVFPKVREFVVKTLRKSAEGKDVVIDGRDAGSGIFPDADVKIFLTASLQERAKRRWKELLSKGYKVSFDEVLSQIKQRDKKDKERKVAPLRIPEGAFVIDTSSKSPQEVLTQILQLIGRARGDEKEKEDEDNSHHRSGEFFKESAKEHG